MRDYGKVYSTFWQSEDMRGLSEDGRTMALYLMTCPHGNMLGCFRLTDAYAADDLQWKSERVRKGFAELFGIGFAYRCDKTNWVFIRQYLKWNPFENPNVAIKALKLTESLRMPNCQKGLLLLALRDFGRHFEPKKLEPIESTVEPFDNPFDMSSKTIAITIARALTITKPEPEPVANPNVDRRDAPLDRDVVPRIFEFWQEIMKSPNSKLDAKRISLIRKALDLGYTARQLCEAIRGCALSPFHMGENDRKTKYNGVNLIFRCADNIDKFILLADGQASAGGAETIEDRNARIIAELMGETLPGDANTIDMEECHEH